MNYIIINSLLMKYIKTEKFQYFIKENTSKCSGYMIMKFTIIDFIIKLELRIYDF